MRKFLFIAVILLIAVTSVQILVTQDRTSQKKQLDQSSGSQETQSGGATIGGDFTLTDHMGRIVHSSNFHGKLLLVFFGFTQCPDICPLTLSIISKAMALLGDKANQVTPLFISVDPSHDTPDVLKNYLSNFDKRIIGLTGTDGQIKEAESAYKVYAAKKEGAGVSDYSIDHSSYIYLMDKDGKFLTVLSSANSEQEISHAIESYLGN